MDSHLGSACSLPSRARRASSWITRRHPTGEAIVRSTHSLSGCSIVSTSSMTSTAIAPCEAARRSSYAARRQDCEHHVGGRPLAFRRTGSLQRGHVPGMIRRLTSTSFCVSMPPQGHSYGRKWTPEMHEVCGCWVRRFSEGERSEIERRRFQGRFVSVRSAINGASGALLPNRFDPADQSSAMREALRRT